MEKTVYFYILTDLLHYEEMSIIPRMGETVKLVDKMYRVTMVVHVLNASAIRIDLQLI